MSDFVFKYNGVETSLTNMILSGVLQIILNSIVVYLAWNYGIALLGVSHITILQAALMYVFGQVVFTDNGFHITPTA
jgi:hypothetical protein